MASNSFSQADLCSWPKHISLVTKNTIYISLMVTFQVSHFCCPRGHGHMHLAMLTEERYCGRGTESLGLRSHIHWGLNYTLDV